MLPIEKQRRRGRRLHHKVSYRMRFERRTSKENLNSKRKRKLRKKWDRLGGWEMKAQTRGQK